MSIVNFNKLFGSKIFILAYENEGGTGEGGTGEGGTGEGGTGNTTKVLTFTQEQLNKLMADNRKKLTQQNQQLIQQLEELKEQTNLTAQQKEELEARIDTLQSQFMSKEEIAKKEALKQTKTFEEQQKKLAQELDSWRSRYTNATIRQDLMAAALEGKAINPEQIVAILGMSTQLKEELGDDGKPTGQLLTIVNFNDTSSEGKPVTLALTPVQVIKRMKELPEKYGNLFHGNAAGGAGGHSGSGSNPSIEMLKDPVKYAEWRKKNPDLDISKLRK